MADFYYRPEVPDWLLEWAERGGENQEFIMPYTDIKDAVSALQTAYDFLEQAEEGPLEEAAKEQISEANMALEDYFGWLEPKITTLSKKSYISPEDYRGIIASDDYRSLKKDVFNAALGQRTGGIVPEMKERWSSAFEGEPWNVEYNPIKTIQMKYQDFGLGPGMGYKPEEHSGLLGDIATAALGFIPGVGPMLSAIVGAVNRGTDKGSDITDWLLGGLKGGLSGYGASKLGSAISNILPQGATALADTGGNMASFSDILNWVSPAPNLTIDGVLSKIPLSGVIDPAIISSIPPSIFSAGLPSGGVDTAMDLLLNQVLNTVGGISNIPGLDLGNLILDESGATGGNLLNNILKIGKNILGGGGGGGQPPAGTQSDNWLDNLLNTILGDGGGGGLFGGNTGLNTLLQILADAYSGYSSAEAREDYMNWIERLYEPQLSYQKGQLKTYEDVFQPLTKRLGGELGDLLSADTSGLTNLYFGKGREGLESYYDTLEQEATERFAGAGTLEQGPAMRYFNVELPSMKAKSMEDLAVETALFGEGLKQQNISNMLSFLGRTPSMSGYAEAPPYLSTDINFGEILKDIISP